ncbi:MAG: diacylglycerol/lipid kinase family protein [Lachnospiraceae bacterium]
MYHIIVNPASRSGRGRHIWKEIIEPALSDKDISYKVYFSEKPGDVVKLARIITAPFADTGDNMMDACRLIILGGDGTVNEALQGISSCCRVIIGYIPTGSSNDLARDVGVPKNPLEALERILSIDDNADIVRPMDRGIVKTQNAERSFAVSTGLGFDAAVCEEAMNSKIKDTLNRLKLGKLTYLGIAIKQLFAARKVSCDLYLDDKEPIHIKKLLFIASMTHRFEGGGFKFCPTADYTDGIFDLCVVGNLPKLIILLALPTAFFGKHFLFPGIDHYRARHIRIKTSAPLWLHTDGEVHEKSDDLEISCAQGDIRFII